MFQKHAEAPILFDIVRSAFISAHERCFAEDDKSTVGALMQNSRGSDEGDSGDEDAGFGSQGAGGREQGANEAATTCRRVEAESGEPAELGGGCPSAQRTPAVLA